MSNHDSVARIIALFEPQITVMGSIFPAGTPIEIDVTERVLSLTAEEIQSLEDDDYATDDLVKEEERSNHDGPFMVRVRAAAARFFERQGIEMGEITDEQLAALRAHLGIGVEREYEVVVARTTTRRVTVRLRATSKDDASERGLATGGDVDFTGADESEADYEIESVRAV